MNVAVIGSGGREHALAYKIAESELLENLFIIPGNTGTKNLGKNVNLDVSNQSEALRFLKSESIDLVVVGPELPLVDGLGDFLRENGIPVFGPDKSAAMIEGDKSFSKRLMKKYGIPTAEFSSFNKDEKSKALEYLKNSEFPVVVKASGLAAGKGVLICENYDEAVSAVDSCFEDEAFGKSGHTIVIEEFLRGEEVSIFAITDGKDYVILPPSQDHKRIFDGDKGKNTGGMGAYAPAPIVKFFDGQSQLKNNYVDIEQIENEIIIPTLNALKEENALYNGCLYAGLMITKSGPKVIEFNCRFGDPETQAVLPLLEGDFLKLLYSAALEKIDKNAINYNGGASVCVVAVSEGYPGKYEKGYEIKGIAEAEQENVLVFHAGAKETDGKIVTNGGRVLGVTSVINSNDLTLAKSISYSAVDKIKYNGIFYRKDISDKAFEK
ncbi:MAG: phosphoribosylamine--glycine ligase [Chlorobi bacterium]|nr:phosphoribosylamine--glycine ligase [Chlorobiota bacterium]